MSDTERWSWQMEDNFAEPMDIHILNGRSEKVVTVHIPSGEYEHRFGMVSEMKERARLIVKAFNESQKTGPK